MTMENSACRIKKKQHIIAMPYPGRGNINPMMNFCKLLITRFSVVDDIKITFVVTEEWFGFLGSSSEYLNLPPQIQLRTIPNVIPSELGRGFDHGSFLEAVRTKMEAPFEQLVEQLQQADDPTKVNTTIITSINLPWAVYVGNRMSIPVVSHWPMSPSVLSIYNHIDLLVQNGHYPVDFSAECGDEVVDYIPGVSPIRLADMPLRLKRSSQHVLGWVKESVGATCRAKCLLFSTYHELEPQDDRDKTYYLKWLDLQPVNSVLYVSFGSFLSASSEQMKEILAGLRESGVRYLLVSRDADNKMTNTRGFVVPWCDQLRVLCHSSVGGFWTHCGWNSTLEGVYAGVPMLTFPLFTDQTLNSKLIVDDWKIGMKVVDEVGAKRLIERSEIAIIVKKFMNLNGDDVESKEMRRRANEFKKSSRQALAKGGSSTTNLDDFMKNILLYHY
ncbi:UDP-glycosyltransferase 87A2-like [Papaver somniferum]|uniref:UDP-glycosyltransferase 87A2-like n=1 Tax=Papaver somniferum TaxID=3469 RepID=UPI000E6FDFCB|nr:UDP-glycosyltransferase 87A2-like [Papaver somniferum]